MRPLSVLSTKPNETHAKLDLLSNMMEPTCSSGVLQQIGECTRSDLDTTARGMMAQTPSSTPRYTRRVTHAPQSLQPTTSRNTIRPRSTRQRGKNRRKENETHFENPIRFESVHAKTSILSAPHDLTPIAERACARPQRSVRPEYRAERRRRPETLGGVDMLEHFARHGEVVLDRLLVRWIHVT